MLRKRNWTHEVCNHYVSPHREDKIASGYISRGIILASHELQSSVFTWGTYVCNSSIVGQCGWCECNRFNSLSGQDTKSEDNGKPCWQRWGEASRPAFAGFLSRDPRLPGLAVTQEAGAEASDLLRAVCRLSRQTLGGSRGWPALGLCREIRGTAEGLINTFAWRNRMLCPTVLNKISTEEAMLWVHGQ